MTSTTNLREYDKRGHTWTFEALCRSCNQTREVTETLPCCSYVDRLQARNEALRQMLLTVEDTEPNRDSPCWCDSYRSDSPPRHRPYCLEIRAALGEQEPEP